MFGRIGIFIYGVLSYAIFFATFLYAVGFIGGFGVPVTIDGEPAVPLGLALLIDTLLLGAFAVQHSVMARPVFKRWWTRIVPDAAERSTYVLFSSLLLIALFVYWEPIGGVIWDVQDPLAKGVLYGIFALGWLTVLVATFLINHFDLFGLRQVWLHLTDKPYTHLRFGMPWLYRHVRHPLYVGWFMAFWATPHMTAAHLLFALATTAYILIAIRFEERDLLQVHPEYAEYRRRVPMLIPRFKRSGNAQPPVAQTA
ncbi:MAG TPA: isoprenylcysteine carboxylmethyltransferase family protein [Gammaproteobacteria bacterium]